MPADVVVTGLGIYTALGKGLDANFQKLKRSEHGLGDLHILQSLLAREFSFGEIPLESTELAQQLGISNLDGITRTSLLGMHAVQEAMQQAGLSKENFPKKRIAFINASTVGGMCEVEKYYFQMLEGLGDYSQYSDTIDIADCTHRIADFFGFTHMVTSVSTACSSSSNAIQFGARLLRHGLADIAICGGTDGLSQFTINGFNALKNLDRSMCKPFDQHRNGLNLGEGAAYLVLERHDDAIERKAGIQAALNAACNYNESFHPTAPNPQGEGAYQVMMNALRAANLEPDHIQYINAHGTATLTNDESESNAMHRLFSQIPAYSSTKPYTGHTLAAAGAVEAVFSILCLTHQCVLPNLNFNTPMEGSLFKPQMQFENKQVDYVMSNSYAFGGNNTSLIFSKYYGL